MGHWWVLGLVWLIKMLDWEWNTQRGCKYEAAYDYGHASLEQRWFVSLKQFRVERLGSLCLTCGTKPPAVLHLSLDLQNLWFLEILGISFPAIVKWKMAPWKTTFIYKLGGFHLDLNGGHGFSDRNQDNRSNVAGTQPSLQ